MWLLYFAFLCPAFHELDILFCFAFSEQRDSALKCACWTLLSIAPNYKYNTYPNKQILVTAIFLVVFFVCFLYYVSRVMHPELTTSSVLVLVCLNKLTQRRHSSHACFPVLDAKTNHTLFSLVSSNYIIRSLFCAMLQCFNQSHVLCVWVMCCGSAFVFCVLNLHRSIWCGGFLKSVLLLFTLYFKCYKGFCY